MGVDPRIRDREPVPASASNVPGHRPAVGALGHTPLAEMLDGLAAAGVLALHDRRLPVVGFIDHLAVTRGGVWVIDAERYCGRAVLTVGRASSGEACVVVSGRRRPTLLGSLNEQLGQVRRALAEADYLDVDVRGAMCVVDTELALFQRRLRLGDCVVTWPKALLRTLARPGPLRDHIRADLLAVLERSFPPAISA